MLNFILKKYDLVILDFETYWSFRRERVPLFNILSINNNLENQFLNIYVSEREKLIESAEYLELDNLFSYSLKVLDQIHHRYNCYLVTSRLMKEETIKQIDQLNLTKYFKEIIITDQNKLAAYSQISNLSMIVGDTENDIIPANKLRVKSFAVSSGIRSSQFLEKLNPTYLSYSLEYILDVL
jgi:phosphoglycolate phosphatase-like HAD superfamily hydrolase